MELNTLRPAKGAKRNARRVGRGISAGKGKTCGRGHKGQGSRKSAGPRAGFEGGQMPFQRRIPKFGFASTTARFVAEVRTGALAKCESDVVNLSTLHAAKLIGHRIKRVKIIAAGEVNKAVSVQGLAVTKGARTLIESAGGKVG